MSKHAYIKLKTLTHKILYKNKIKVITVIVIYHFPPWIKAVERSELPHQSKVTAIFNCLDTY